MGVGMYVSGLSEPPVKAGVVAMCECGRYALGRDVKKRGRGSEWTQNSRLVYVHAEYVCFIFTGASR